MFYPIKASDFRPIRLDRYFPEWHQVYSKVEALNNEGKELEITQRSDLNI
jgi:acyl-CoA thioester hydrolase